MSKRILCTLLLAASLIFTACGNKNTGLTSDAAAELRAETAATSEDLSVNGAAAAYFFNDVYTSFTTSMASRLDELGLDTSKPLGKQTYGDTESATWLAYFMSGACTYIKHYMTLCESADFNGIALTDEEITALEARAARGVKGKYGENLDASDILEAMKLEALANKFESIKTAELMPTEEEMYTYAKANTSDYSYPETATVNVRHILFSTDTYGSAEAALAKANEVMGVIGDSTTPEAFSLLALEYSDDPSTCYIGGLYKNLASGFSKADFNAWCFDEARTDGELDVIETEYGAHIMYFESAGLPKWQGDISNIMITKEFEAICELLYTKYPVTFDQAVLDKIAE